jgi:perosamine synthetase
MHAIHWWRTQFGAPEIQNLSAAVLNENISQGDVTVKWESEVARHLGVPFCVATTSGSVALLIALMALGIGQDDEVLVPNRTWIASAHAVAMLGAKAVLVDVLPDLPLLDIADARAKITPRTKAIMPVHLGGRAVDMTGVHTLAEAYGLKVVEDASQAFMSRNASGFLGTQSDVGCFSLSVAKLISTGQGGFVVTRCKETQERLRLLRSHGVANVIHATYTNLGFNFRFTDLQAAFGMAQLERIPQRLRHVRAVYDRYAEGLKSVRCVTLLPIDVESGEVPLYTEVLCENRNAVMGYLEAHGIQTRPFYPDLDQAHYLGNTGAFCNARRFGESGLFLPCGPDQPIENVDTVLEVLRSFDNEN